MNIAQKKKKDYVEIYNESREMAEHRVIAYERKNSTVRETPGVINAGSL